MGLEDDLVGVSHECDFPPSVVGLPVLTRARLDSSAPSASIHAQVAQLGDGALSIYEVLEDTLAEVRPDVVLTQDTCKVCAVSLDDVRVAARRVLGSHVELESLSPASVADVFGDVQRVAEVCGVSARASAWAQGARERLAAVERAVEGLPRPKTQFLEWIDPPMPPGHWTPELLRIAGAEVVMGHEQRPTTTTTWAAIRAADPDVVLVGPCGFDLPRTIRELCDGVATREVQELRAFADNRVVALDGNAYFNRPGPRLVDSAELAATCLFPELEHRGPEWATDGRFDHVRVRYTAPPA